MAVKNMMLATMLKGKNEEIKIISEETGIDVKKFEDLIVRKKNTFSKKDIKALTDYMKKNK